MRIRVHSTLLAAIALSVLHVSTPARAAKLVVLAVNSGIDTTAPYINTQPPNLLPPGAKGFLIGIDLEDNLQDVALGVQNLEFTGVIHQQGLLDELGDPYPSPLNIKTRSQATLQEILDGVATNGYRRSDSYVMDNPQQGSFVWTPVGPGFEGGDSGDNFLRITGSLGLPSQLDGPGPVQLAYIVATGDVGVSGIIARGAVGFDPRGDPSGTPGQITLFFERESFIEPEPSSVVLMGAAAIGLAACTWRRRRTANRMRG